jgi:dTDP-4-amino-4,6-dideoxygalactose transaminase
VTLVYARAMEEKAAGERAAHVPFVDLSHVHERIRADLLEDVSNLIDTGAFINGPAVLRFEEEFAAYCETNECVGLSSGLDALRLALLALGVGRGDEVVVPAHTFIATVEAVRQVGARPVLVDIGETDYNIDPEGVEAAISGRTRALLPVHLYGQLADMERLTLLADRSRGISIVEDAAQAHGAARDGWRAGASGTIGAFSFYPAKNLGALGDAGAATTDDARLAAHLRALREHGQFDKNDHSIDGYTARLDTVHAVALLHKLPLLDGWNEARRAVAAFYEHHLIGVGDLRLPSVPEGSRPVWHLFVTRTADPEALATHLAEAGIASGRHYPQPLHLAPALAELGHRRGEFPVSEAVAAEGLSLPVYPGISEEQLTAVVSGVQSYFDRSGGPRPR